MNPTLKCCELCSGWVDSPEGAFAPYRKCANRLCTCHTPKKESWKQILRADFGYKKYARVEVNNLIDQVEKLIIQERAEAETEVILNAFSSNNPIEWLRNYALYQGISLTHTHKSTKEETV